MISSISHATKVADIKSATATEKEKTVATGKTGTKPANASQSQLAFGSFLPSEEKAVTGKFIDSSTKVFGDIALAEKLPAEEKATLLKELFSTIDKRFHGAFNSGKNDGLIDPENIRDAKIALYTWRDGIAHYNNEKFELKDKNGERLSKPIIDSMLKYLEDAIKDFGNDNSTLSLAQLNNSLKKVPPGRDSYTKDFFNSSKPVLDLLTYPRMRTDPRNE